MTIVRNDGRSGTVGAGANKTGSQRCGRYRGAGHALFNVVSASINTDAMVELRVKDNGHGLLPHLKEKLFSPFMSNKADGLGVGLSIVAR